MTIEEVREKITQILNKEGNNGSEGISGSSDITDNQTEDIEDVVETRASDGNRLKIHEVEEYRSIFNGTIVNGYILNNREMTRKEYLQYTRGLKHEEVLSHPLMYVMFRAEGQGEANFFEWLAKFKR
jgi:hypothetical protein